jgi:hypothetical protein
MTSFRPSNEVQGVVQTIVPVSIVITRHELEGARTSADRIALAEKKKAQAIADLRSRLQGLEFDISAACDAQIAQVEGAAV